MQAVALPPIGTVAAWRAAVRDLAARGVAPGDVVWSVGDAAPDLFALAPAASHAPTPLRLTRTALADIERALLHRDPARFALAHRMVIRLSQGEVRWPDRSDPDIRRLIAMAANVRRDIHKMHAFVRFRELPPVSSRRRFAAWFEPEHPITEAVGPFFANRFGDMDWVIATPQVTLVFDGTLRAEVTKERPPRAPDGAEDLWRTYFASIFNPARLNPRMMQSEMPAKYWKNLPEADLIPGLIAGAPAAVQAMRDRALSQSPPAFRTRAARTRDALAAPAPGSLADLAAQAAGCTRCPLHAPATQTVWGEGPPDARLMIVGEAPGDAEDLRGRPFSGPAGQVLDDLLAEVGGDRAQVYLTNAVKHFRFRPAGRRRLHVRPDTPHVDQCRWWLDHERRLIRPRVILGLGATAALAVTGRGTDVTARAGHPEDLPDGTVFVPALHPAHILRLPGAEAGVARATLRDALALALRLAA